MSLGFLSGEGPGSFTRALQKSRAKGRRRQEGEEAFKVVLMPGAWGSVWGSKLGVASRSTPGGVIKSQPGDTCIRNLYRDHP